MHLPTGLGEVTQTQKGRTALPHLQGANSSGDCVASFLLKCQYLWGRKGLSGLTRAFSSLSERSILPRQAPSNIRFLKELGK